MKKLQTSLTAMAIMVLLSFPAAADVMSPGRAIQYELEKHMPIVLVIVVAVITAIIVRRKKKK